MQRVFNTTGSCNPERHYMVNIDDKLAKIKVLVDSGAYFTINRARQYGKTTTISELVRQMQEKYCVISLDFQRIDNEEFETTGKFSSAFVEMLIRAVRDKKYPVEGFDEGVLKRLEGCAEDVSTFSLRKLFELLSVLCETSTKPVVLIIDEVDSASNNQVFLDFLAQLRAYYLARNSKETPTFHSVILAGVYDIRNLRRKLRPEEEHKVNSPWNIAADFDVDMSLSKVGIEGMLKEYEADHHTGMDTGMMAGLIYDSTSGYPFLVSRLCKLIDERVAGSGAVSDKASAWTREGYLEAEKMLVSEKNTLFESLTGKVREYPALKDILVRILFQGNDIPYISTNESIEIATLLGFIKNEHNRARISNRIFETVLTDYFLLEEMFNSKVYSSAAAEKNRFIQGGRLNMRLVLERFVDTFTELYKDEEDRFKEEIGRKYFLLFLKPIINGTGHYYVEARTRDMKRTDVVVDYAGEQFVVELKIWRGPQYNEDGEEQTAQYLDFYGLQTGYMVIFNFTKKKEIGVVEKQYGDKLLIEATV